VRQVPSKGDWAWDAVAAQSATMENSAQTTYRFISFISVFLQGNLIVGAARHFQDCRTGPDWIESRRCFACAPS
jgi:hypothetical protein